MGLLRGRQGVLLLLGGSELLYSQGVVPLKQLTTHTHTPHNIAIRICNSEKICSFYFSHNKK